MAGFDRNSRHANNMHGLINHAMRQEPEPEPEPNTGTRPRIACRVCGRILMSDKALFDHMELHLLLDEDDARKKLLLSHLSNTQRTFTASGRFNQNPVPILPKESNPFSIGTKTRNLDHLLQHSSAATAPSPAVSFGSMNNNYVAPPLMQTQLLQPSTAAAAYGTGAVQIVLMPVPQPRNQCFTKPFLNQLEASLLVEGMASIVERQMADKLGNDDQTLDVTLKL